ncbi:phasin family protein [Pseudochelatococcus lubricantis]|uniref:Phasin family protein n=1 Tax=Pseudochelatococcus lubricantis TaxID=1538102 RepID=A0ABX0V102_9HYPH|nr:phasin family protein [Pseudochelatococcus lubricantis]NIJ57789.1 phasin family protein [Pseudochelatococcus lubricantis]
MAAQYEDVQKFGKEQIDSSLKAFGAFSKGLQGIAAELADYTKRSFEEGTSALEKLAAAKTLDKALEIQTEYARTAYENFVAESTRIGELYTDLTREAFKPYEGAFARSQSQSH